MTLTEQSRKKIAKLYQGRKHVELTIGTLKDGKIETVHWGPDMKQKNDEVLVYPVGSICKPFTTAMLAKYISEGKLDLNAPLSEYIQPLPEQYYPSLRKLATHSSGYAGTPHSTWTAIKLLARMNKPNGILRVNPYHGIDGDDMMRILAEKPMKDKEYPFAYSNFGMGVLGYIVGAVSGLGFWDGLQEYIKQDLGLAHTSLGNTDMIGYDKKDQPCNCWPWDKTDMAAPAGALLSSVEDLLCFAKQQMDGSKPYLELCHQVHSAGEKGKDFDSGLAWRLKKGTGISYHGGNAGAYSAFLCLDRQKQTAAVVAINYGLVDDVEPLGFSLLEGL